MSKRIIIKPKASLDIDEHYAYLEQNNPDTALKFFDATRETFAQLARMPGMGSRVELKNPRLQELRKWSVKGFKKYLIFYCDQDEYLEIIRLLYAGQNIEKILIAE